MFDKDAFGPGYSAVSDEEPILSEAELAARKLDAELKAEMAFLEPVMVLNGDIALSSVARDAVAVTKHACTKLEARRAEKIGDIKLSRTVAVYAGVLAVLLVSAFLFSFDRSTPGQLIFWAVLVTCAPLGVCIGCAASASDGDLVLKSMTAEQALRDLKWEHLVGNSLDVPLLLIGRDGLAFRHKGQAFYSRFSSVRSVSADTRPYLSFPILNLSLDLSHLHGYSPVLDLAVYAPKSSVGETEAAIANHIATIVATSAAHK